MKTFSFSFLVILVLISSSFNVHCQEQVSNVEFYGVTTPTNVSSKVGFATYNGEHYIIQEKDSVLIYKYQKHDRIIIDVMVRRRRN